ncbi:MAG: B12-binding domain-containing protein [Candidatus Hydrothermarchaeales archaeon]
MITNAIINGEIGQIEDMVREALDADQDADQILKDMIKGMDVVGEKYENKEYYVPETLLSAHAMQKGLEVLRPHLNIDKLDVQGRIVIGTVEGDVHDIGKNLVSMFLEGAGFHVFNLGRDVPPSIYVEKIMELKPDIVGLSAMMSTTMEKVRETIKEFEGRGIRDGTMIVVGGACVTQKFAKEIGANGYAADAKKAVRLCERLMREKNGLL